MIDNNFEEKLISKIKDEHIEPNPKWHFLLKDYLVWGFGMLSLALGGTAFSVIIYLVKYNDWDIYDTIKPSLWESVVLALPYFWILFLALFIFILYYNIRHTKTGYRYSLSSIIIVNVLASVVIGSLFFYVGVGQALDDVMGEKAPYYSKIMNPHMQFWSQPEAGRLMGVVVSRDSDNSVLVIDMNKNEWGIDLGSCRTMPMTELVVGKTVRVSGEMVNTKLFKASMIMPMRPPGQGRFKRNMEHNSMYIQKYEMHMSKVKCNDDDDCRLPPDFAIRSDCPFTAKCIDNKCEITCSSSFMFKEAEMEGSMQCHNNQECDCGFYAAKDKKECRCHEEGCMVVVDGYRK